MFKKRFRRHREGFSTVNTVQRAESAPWARPGEGISAWAGGGVCRVNQPFARMITVINGSVGRLAHRFRYYWSPCGQCGLRSDGGRQSCDVAWPRQSALPGSGVNRRSCPPHCHCRLGRVILSAPRPFAREAPPGAQDGYSSTCRGRVSNFGPLNGIRGVIR